jgi:hypothetical protein
MFNNDDSFYLEIRQGNDRIARHEGRTGHGTRHEGKERTNGRTTNEEQIRIKKEQETSK